MQSFNLESIISENSLFKRRRSIYWRHESGNPLISERIIFCETFCQQIIGQSLDHICATQPLTCHSLEISRVSDTLVE